MYILIIQQLHNYIKTFDMCISGVCETKYHTTWRMICKLLVEKEIPEKTHPRWCSNRSQKFIKIFKVHIMESRGELFEKFIGSGKVYHLKTIHKIKKSQKRKSYET